jgi:cytochrome c553
VAVRRRSGFAIVPRERTQRRWWIVLLLLTSATASADVVDALLDRYRAEGAGPFSAVAGQALWTRGFPDPNGGAARSCARCHTRDPRAWGRHAVSGKRIEPMKPAVNRERLSDASFVERWLRKSCLWTLRRECTAQEKGDLLRFIRD